MNVITLMQPLTDEGIRTVNFFNGRLLSGEDLSQEQIAQRQARQHLGRAIGNGIVTGLEVAETVGVSTATAPVVTVKSGLAVNRRGETLHLASDAQVLLVRTVDGTNATTMDTVFAECRPLEGGVYIAGAGVYLLTIAPGWRSEGRAPVTGLGNSTASCNTRYTVEGVQFRLLQLELSNSELTDPRLRNLVAYKCFDVQGVREFAGNPFGPLRPRRGLLDELRPTHLTDSEVPLALIYWTTGGMQFVDLWSVRRRVTHPAASPATPYFPGDDQYLSEAEAILLQFADHLARLRVTLPNPASLVATQRFQYLPPVGLLPLAGGTAPGFSQAQFFSQRVCRGPIFLEGSRVEGLFNTALRYPPIDLSGKEMLWLYIVRENRDPAAFAGQPTPSPYLIFTTGHLPPQTEARFNISRWNYSNYTIA